jgi:RHH-type rel operon transcriptional repressor/antitoxin RelB
MNKQLTLDMPDQMHRLLLKYAAAAGREPYAYVLDLLEEKLEDTYFLRRAEEVMQARQHGESITYTWEELLGAQDPPVHPGV